MNARHLKFIRMQLQRNLMHKHALADLLAETFFFVKLADSQKCK